MKYLFLILSVAFCSCGAFKKAKKNAKELIEYAKEHPEDLDTLGLTVHDTTKTNPIHDEKEKVTDPKLVRVIDSLSSLLQQSKNQKTKTQIVDRIIERACIEVDETYQLEIYNDSTHTFIPVRVHIWKEKGKQRYTFDVPKVRIPETRIFNKITFIEPKKSIFRDAWFYVACVFGLIALIQTFRR